MVSFDSGGIEPPRFLLTLRSRELKHHSGQVCLPGGWVEEAERQAPLRALDREFEEEVGIASGSIEWEDAPWDPLMSRHGVSVSPYLGFMDRAGNLESELSFSPEVSEGAWLDLGSLFDPKCWQLRDFISGSGAQARVRPLPIWLGWNHVTWGLTAGFLALFVRRISGRPPIELPL